MHKNDYQRLLAIKEAIQKIFDYSAEFNDADEFLNDMKSFDAVIMNFIIIGEMVTRLSGGFKENHPDIDWLKIKAFRNIAAHDYFGIDAEEVWQIIHNHLPPFQAFVKKITIIKRP